MKFASKYKSIGPRLKRLWDCDLTKAEIAVRLEVTVSTLALAILYYHLPRKRHVDPVHKGRRARDRKIIRLRGKGWSFQKIGQHVGLTRQRVSQIVAKEK